MTGQGYRPAGAGAPSGDPPNQGSSVMPERDWDAVRAEMDDLKQRMADAKEGKGYVSPVVYGHALDTISHLWREHRRMRAEIGRLQVAFRVNALRWGYTDALIDEVLRPGMPPAEPK